MSSLHEEVPVMVINENSSTCGMVTESWMIHPEAACAIYGGLYGGLGWNRSHAGHIYSFQGVRRSLLDELLRLSSGPA